MFRKAVPLALLLTAAAGLQANAQSSGRFHLVRSTSGSKGAPDGGRFVFEDPRSIFVAGQDRQVLVLFEWQGPLGRHRCEGAWKDPSGRVVFTSEAEVQARGPRFAVYWGLSLPDTVATGTWVLEARVDGEAAGTHAFQIQGVAVAVAPQRRPLSLAELYRQGLDATLTLQVIDASGSQIDTTSGLFATPDLVSTSLAGINAAHSVRLVRAGAGRLETGEAVSWNRREDWAVLRYANAGGKPVERGPAPAIGDRCFFLDAQGEQNRVIVETSVVGVSPEGDLTLAAGASEASLGSPVFNEHGDVVAVLAGSGVLGADVLDLAALGGAARFNRGHGARARPLPPAPDPEAASRQLAELDREGLFVRRLARTPHFVSGILGSGVGRQGKMPIATEQRFRFSRRDGECVVFMTWVPAKKEDATTAFELFDADNRKIAATEPKRTRLREGESFVQYWGIPLATLKAGIHRVDVLIGVNPVWRTFFAVTD